MQHKLTDIVFRRPFINNLPARSSAAGFSFLLVISLLVGAFLCTRFLDFTALAPAVQNQKAVSRNANNDKKVRKSYPLNCTAFNLKRRCSSSDYPTTTTTASLPLAEGASCPEYFRWIHEDLRPWARTGITREMVERAKRTANFRLVVVDGKAYLEKYRKSFQSRDTFTIWSILQLLRRYPGRLPDLDIMFDCVDWPVVKSSDFNNSTVAPPPLFRYCGDDHTLDIVFPDWSFWGWPEINIKPWMGLLEDLKEGNKKIGWMEREPYAYWKGNPSVAATRQDLMKCNVTPTQDWNARVYAQDWLRESQQGYKESDLANQCNYRFKIYIEGSAWSVSEKYILACDSVALLVKPQYYDFFTRSLIPNVHYWPVKETDKCRSIKFAVDWGNSHKEKAQAMGKAASEFIQKELRLDYVYDYMFHLLNEYAKLLTYKPEKPRKAFQICPEAVVCQAQGLAKKFLMDSLEKSPAETGPCRMAPPFDPPSLHDILRRRDDSIEEVESWEKEFWDNQSKQA